MSGKHRLTKSFKGLDVTKQDKRKRIRGILGNVIGGNQVVEVTTRPGYVWVRLRDQQSEIIQAFNDSVSPVYDLPVFVTRDSNDPTRYVIDSRDTAQYQNWGAGAAYLPRHANQHSFSDDAGAAGDVVWVYGRQFMPLLAYPSGSNGANNVIISPYTYFAQSQNWIYSGNTGTASIVAYKPTGSNARVVLVYMDVNGNPQLLPGDYFAATITGTSQIVQYLPDLPNNTKPIAAIRLVSGTAIINWNNIYDIRQFYNDSVVAPTTPSLGIAVYEDHVYKATGTVLDFTDNMNVAVTGSSIFISSTGGGGVSTGTATLGARVYRTLDQSIPNGLTGTAIIWTNEEYDDDNIHSGSSTKLVCNTAGTYLIVGNVEWVANNSGERQLFIRLNGQNITGILGIVVDQNGGAAVGQIQNVSTVWDLNVGDYVELCAAHSSTTSPLSIAGEVAATEFPTFMMQRFGDAGSSIINTGTVVVNNTYNTYNTNNEVAILDDGVFKVTGSAISFDNNLSVAVTGSVAFVSSVAGGGGLSAIPIYDDHVFRASGTLIDFTDGLVVDITGSSVYISSIFGTGSNGIGARVTSTVDRVYTGTSVLKFNSIDYDTDDMFSLANDTRLTCNTAGYYLVIGNVSMTPPQDSYSLLGIRKNGGFTYAEDRNFDVSVTGYATLHVSYVDYFNSGNFVELIVSTQGSGSARVIDIKELAHYSPIFMMHKLDILPSIIVTGTVNINTYQSSNALPIYDSGVFVVTGTYIDFADNLSVAVTGSAVFVSAPSGGGGGITERALPIQDSGIFVVTGTAINFVGDLLATSVGSVAQVEIPSNTFASGSHTHPAGAAAIQVFEDSVFKATGTAISFNDNLNVFVTGTTAFVNAVGGSSIQGTTVTITGAFLIDNAIVTPLEWQIEVIDELGFWSVSDKTKMLINATNWYMISCYANWSANTAGTRKLDIINSGTAGVNTIGSNKNTATGGDNTNTVSAIERLVSGSYVYITGLQDSGGQRQVEDCRWSIAKL